MMSVQARIPFESVTPEGCLQVSSLQLPPTPAIYTLRFRLRRPGWSVLDVEDKILLRPFRHDEYERFLAVAMPYYVSWMSLLGATFICLIPMLLSRVLRGSKAKKDEGSKKDQ
jgi:oligosaccharyltransferase complex subunit beta